MPPVSAKLLGIRTRFERTRKVQEEFVLSLPTLQRPAGRRCVTITQKQQETLCEMAFAVLFTAWEQFLEHAFESHVADAPVASFGKRHRVIVVDVETAHDLIRGNRGFAEWADHNLVCERAKVFFKGGEPFYTPLSSIAGDLKRMRIIRNHCVHFSQHASEQYKKLIREVCGSGGRLTPGCLLLNAPPTALSTSSGALSYPSVFKLYSDILSTAVGQIVPEKKR